MSKVIKFSMIYAVLSILFLLVSTCSMLAQGQKGKFGLGISPVVGGTDLLFKKWESSKFAYETAIGLSIVKSKEGKSTTNWRLGLGIFYHPRIDTLTTYIGTRVAFNILSADGHDYTDKLFAIVWGAEYFISKKFSLGGELQFSVIIADNDISPSGFFSGSKNYGTGHLLFIRFYIN